MRGRQGPAREVSATVNSIKEPDVSHRNADADLTIIIGENLRRFRTQQNLSLEKLARTARVSRAMLGQIELGKSAPSITVLTRIAAALERPVTAFLSRQPVSRVTVLPVSDTQLLHAAGGDLISRALFPFSRERKVEFYELRLAKGCDYQSEAHAAATTENLVVSSGQIELEVGGKSFRLSSGDAIFFAADAIHSYRNVGAEPATAYLVMCYPEKLSY